MSTISDISDLSSELSSVPNSPTPPPSFYPSPPPSQELANNAVISGSQTSTDQKPAAKRKYRKAEPKPRVTRHLDLTGSAGVDQSAELELLLKTLRKKQKIVVVAGAGISVSSGIPDFRSSNGLFSSLKKDHKLKTTGKQLFDISVYQEESTTASFHDMVRSLSSMAKEAKPSPFHRLLEQLGKGGRLKRLYTQNVDEIDTHLEGLETEVPLSAKGRPWPLTIQLHGGLSTMVCQKCRDTSDLQPERFDGPIPPLCPECQKTDDIRTAGGQRSHGVGKLRPRIVLYNEQSPDEEAIGSVVTADLRSRPDALIVVGTSLKIPGVRRIVREMSRVVRGRRDGVTMWINPDSMPAGKEFQDCWDLVVKGDSDAVANYGLESLSDIRGCSASEVERYRERHRPEVVIQTPKKEPENCGEIPTPPVSQDEGSVASTEATNVQTQPLTNPASNGPPISEVLGHKKNKTTPKRKQRKPAAPRKTATQKAQVAKDQAGKINQRYRVDKPGKSNATEVSKSIALKNEEASKPMLPLSPGAARSNGPMLPDPEASNSSSPSSPGNSKVPSSPASRLPRGMEMLLDCSS